MGGKQRHVAGRNESVQASDRRYDAAAYGDGCADFYDQLYPRLPAAALSRLIQIAGGQPILDLGVGTGRAAIPLARHGCDVWGVEASQAMLQRLHERATGLSVRTVRADLASFDLPQHFGLIVALVNTLALLPPPSQQDCLRCAASHLSHDGSVLIESIGPAVDDEQTRILVDTSSGPREYRVRLFASGPQQLDAMAARAGLALTDRWQDWLGKPWHPAAAACIAVYRKA
jgi:SAM-dependent methyltransferase